MKNILYSQIGIKMFVLKGSKITTIWGNLVYKKNKTEFEWLVA